LEKINIEIPGYIRDDAELIAWVKCNADLFKPAMDLEESVYDSRACLDSVHIKHVELAGDVLTIAYTFDYSVRVGCGEKIFSGESVEDRVVGKRSHRFICFSPFS